MARTPSFRRRLALASFIALAGVVVSGCPKSKGKDTQGGERIEFWTMQLKPTFEGYIGDLIKRWEKTHPGVHVEWVDLPANEIENKTLTAAASDRPPDLVNLNPSFANKLAGAGALLAIAPDAAYKAQFFDAGWQANTVNGQVVGYPWYLSTSVTFYNTSVWKQAGLKEGDWPKTYTELGDKARAILAATKTPGFMPNFGDRGHFMEILASEGVPLISADHRHPAFNTPQAQAVVKFWAHLFQDGAIPKESLTQGHREAIDRFQAGQTAVFPAGPQFLGIIKQNSPKLYEQLAVGPQITGASGKMGVQVMTLVIPKASPHQALARDLARFVISGPNQLAFAKLVPILPSVKVAASDPYFAAKGDDSLEARARELAARQLPHASLLVPPLPHESELAKSLDDALQRAALGQQPPAQALEQASSEWDRILAQP